MCGAILEKSASHLKTTAHTIKIEYNDKIMLYTSIEFKGSLIFFHK
jgi:hypothetical protein